MNRQVVDLGFVLKQIPDFDFSMDVFEDRLKLQKSLYLLQSFGIYLGYDFSWYLRGPYCTSLAINAFALEEIYNEIPGDTTTKFKESRKQKLFVKFQKLVKNKSIDDLEIMVYLHYLKQLGDLSDDEIKTTASAKQERFTIQQTNDMWNELQKYDLI